MWLVVSIISEKADLEIDSGMRKYSQCTIRMVCVLYSTVIICCDICLEPSNSVFGTVYSKRALTVNGQQSS